MPLRSAVEGLVLAEREGLLAAAPLVPRCRLGTAGARRARRRSPPLTRRLTEPGLFIFEGSNPASYGGKDLAERESAFAMDDGMRQDP